MWKKQASGPKAWVNFDGTNCPSGWCSIRGSIGVSGVARVGVGQYRVYFSSLLPIANYSPVIGLGRTDAVFCCAGIAERHMTGPLAVDGFMIGTANLSAMADSQVVTAHVFAQ